MKSTLPKTLYTDGACSGNPGPGGWAWASADNDDWASGCENPSTNQRMEVYAVLDALRANPGPVTIVSDSTYVVHCFRDKWWDGWIRRGWRNSAKKPVANRDIWEPLIGLYLQRRDELTFRWVKGHGTDAMNIKVDELAVAAALNQRGRVGTKQLDEVAGVEPVEGVVTDTAQRLFELP